MKTALRFLLGLALLGGGFLADAQAAPGWQQAVNMETDSGVTIDILSAFAKAPESGFMPLQIRIINRSGGARAYNFRASSSGPQYTGHGRMTAFQSVRVDNDAESRTEMLLPVSPGDTNYRQMTIEVNGYGVQTPQVLLPTDYRSSGNPTTVYVGMSEKLSTRSWGTLEKNLSDQSKTLRGGQMDLTLLPPDWRALTGVQCLWLTPEDYLGLDPATQTAVKDWVSQGGILYICESAANGATRTEFGVRDPAGASVPVGFGEVRWFRSDNDRELSVDKAASEIIGLGKQQDEPWDEAERWSVSKEIGALKLNVPFLLGFIGLFAIFVGPVNLFYLARENQRHRLFWTTPAISLGASLLLIGVIVLQDGFGGNGSRVMVTHLLPAQNKAVTVQEQVSRTGVLFSRAFATEDDVYLAPVIYRTTDNRQLQQTGKSYDGDWFASRSVQAQRIEAVQQTRSRVQLLNAEQARAGAPPVVVSSLPVELEEFFYRDDGGRYWHASNVHTGQARALRPDTDVNFHLPGKGGSVYLDALFKRTERRPGYFYALAKGGPFVGTLPSIRWTHDHAVFLGPVTTDR